MGVILHEIFNVLEVPVSVTEASVINSRLGRALKAAKKVPILGEFFR
jgi:hypothetical protein